MENEVLKAIKERRSSRRFKADQITDEELKTVLEAGTWAATGWYTKKDTTANRPTGLTSSDAGVQFFDTTLAAAGKPIWWTGTAWVDSTGAGV